VHLPNHAYLQQAYTVLRPVHENCDLIELFAQNPSEAADWINAEKPGIKYSPAKVRARIGEPDVSKDIYGHLSEMGSHPRFAGSRITGAMRVRVDDPSVRQILLRMGSFYERHLGSVRIYAWIFEAVIRLGFKVRHLELVSDRVSRDQWVSAYLACVQAASQGYKLIRQELLSMNAADGTEFMETVYDDLIASLEPGGALATLGDDPAIP
jgi:hypothetical protein